MKKQTSFHKNTESNEMELDWNEDEWSGEFKSNYAPFTDHSIKKLLTQYRPFEDSEEEEFDEAEENELKDMEKELMKLQDEFESEGEFKSEFEGDLEDLEDMETDFLKELQQIKSEFLQMESDMKVTNVTETGTNSNNKRPKAPLVKEKQISLFKQRK